MDKRKRKLTEVECLRCDYKWYPRKPLIIRCPHCGSPYWNRERNVKKGEDAGTDVEASDGV